MTYFFLQLLPISCRLLDAICGCISFHAIYAYLFVAVFLLVHINMMLFAAIF